MSDYYDDDFSASYGGYDYGRSKSFQRDLNELRRLAELLDEAVKIPVIGYRVGLDALLGLVPVIGDFSGFAISSYIIFKAHNMGVPREKVSRMVFNSLVDVFVGSIPVVGDLFDVFWKSNKRNMKIVERHFASYSAT